MLIVHSDVRDGRNGSCCPVTPALLTARRQHARRSFCSFFAAWTFALAASPGTLTITAGIGTAGSLSALVTRSCLLRSSARMSSEPGYRLKLRRAKDHLDFIDGKGREFIQNNLFAPIPFEAKPENEWTILRRGYVEPLDPMWGTYLGDFVHNVRSALDNLVCAMILRHDPDQCVEHAAFPAYDGKRKWISEIIERDRETKGLAPTDGVSDKVLAAIERSQPYRVRPKSPQRAPLFLLQAASNTDKHRTIHATKPRVAPRSVGKGKIRMVPADCFQVLRRKIAPPGTPLETGAEVGRLKLRKLREPPPGADVGVNVTTPMEIAFSVEGKPGEMSHLDIWAMIGEAWKAVLRAEHAAGITGLPRPHAKWNWEPHHDP